MSRTAPFLIYLLITLLIQLFNTVCEFLKQMTISTCRLQRCWRLWTGIHCHQVRVRGWQRSM